MKRTITTCNCCGKESYSSSEWVNISCRSKVIHIRFHDSGKMNQVELSNGKTDFCCIDCLCDYLTNKNAWTDIEGDENE